MKNTPLAGHPYHQKSVAQLLYIIRDAGEAAVAMRDHSPESEAKYLDQVNDASTVLHYRRTHKLPQYRKPFYYGGGTDAKGYYLVVDATTGQPITGWFFYMSAADKRAKRDPIGPFDTESDALFEATATAAKESA